MSLEKIVIKELSNQAEIINIFNCKSGYITIFNGANTMLGALERLFCGIYEKNDLNISINDSLQFDPTLNTFIGYNSILKDNTISVRNLFESYNFDQNDLEVILSTYGLHNIEDFKIYELDDDKKRRLEYALAFQGNGALIIKDPFKDIIPQWKEPIAKFIYTYASKKNLPVIITELNYESSFFNNCEQIKKYKLGISRTKTIGFGTNNQDLKDFISQIRDEIQNNELNKKATKEELHKTRDPISPNLMSITDIMPEVFEESTNQATQEKVEEPFKQFNKKELKKIHNKLFAIGCLFFISSIFIVVFMFKKKSDTNLENIRVRQENFKKEVTIKPKPIDNNTFNHNEILENYPEWIKNTIELQLRKKEILKEKSRNMPFIKRGNTPPSVNKTNNNLFKLLEGISGSGNNIPDNIGNSPLNTNGYRNNDSNTSSNQGSQSYKSSTSDAEAKRQLLYQRFQEAIRRSREQNR